MMRSVACLIALLVSGQVQALSCMRPDAVASYINAAEAADVYYVILGEVTLDRPAPARPDTGTYNEAPNNAVRGEITGKSLGPNGFQTSVNLGVKVHSLCAGPWCGPFPPRGPALMFVKNDQPRPVLEMDPCSTQYFGNPTPEMIEKVQTCHRGGTCEPAEF